MKNPRKSSATGRLGLFRQDLILEPFSGFLVIDSVKLEEYTRPQRQCSPGLIVIRLYSLTQNNQHNLFMIIFKRFENQPTGVGPSFPFEPIRQSIRTTRAGEKIS